jgi:hypothetical protein
MSIKPIETVYKGYRFRSRLEARWAVFFDALDIKWEYEPEGFDLGDDGKYLPDFRLPTFDGGLYAEVKPDGERFSKAQSFAEITRYRVWLCEGVPSIRAYMVLTPMDIEPGITDDFGDEYPDGQKGEVIELPGIPNADHAEGENRMFSCPGYERDDLSLPEDTHRLLGDTFMKAVVAARSARFEYGEQPRFA